MTAGKKTLGEKKSDTPACEYSLWDSEEKYRRIVETSHEGIWAMNGQFVTTYVNERMAEMLGYPVNEILGKTIQSFMSGEDLADQQQKIEERRHGQPGSYERRFRAKDGTILTFNVSATPIMGDQGSFEGSFAMLTDITARKRSEEELLKNAEELHASYEEITAIEEELRANLDELTRKEQELQESETKYRTVIEQSHDGIFIAQDGIIVFFNTSFSSMTGYPDSELAGRSIADMIAPEDRELVMARHHDRLKGILHSEVYEFSVLHHDRMSRIPVKMKVKSANIRGKPATIGTLHNMTDERNRERALQESRRQLDSMATNIPGVVFRYYVNPDGTSGFDYISGRSREILGLENDKATFDNRFTEGIVPENRERFLSSIQHAVTTQTLWEFDSPYVKPSGEKIWVSAVSSPIMEHDRLIFDGAFFDITQRKRAEVELVKKNEELNASYEQIAAAEEELRGNLDELTRQERALRESETQLRATLESTADGILAVDNTGKMVLASRRFAEIWKIPPSLMERGNDQAMLDFVLNQLTDPDAFLKKVQELYNSDAVDMDTLTFKDRRVFERYSFPMIQDGVRIGRVWSFRDITERKKAEDEIVKKNEELNASYEQIAAAEEELKGQFDALAESEQMIRESEGRVRNKLESLLSPGGDIGNLDLADIINVQEIQSMMDDFNALTHIGIAILDINGKILVATGWQDICTKFHRVNPETCANCAESDTLLSSGVEPGTVKRYRCKNNMWDLVTPIVIGGSHVGNLFLGQFLFEDESVNDELFRAQAVRYGFDEQSYLDALDRVPRWNQETIDTVMAFYTKFARMVSTLSHSNITLARTVTERDTTLNSLLKVNQKLNVLSQLTRQDLTTQIFIVNSFLEMAKKQAKGQDGIIKNIESGERAVRSIKEITEFTKDYQNMGEKPSRWQNVKLAFLLGLSHISIGEIRHSLETETLEIFADPLLEKAFQGLLENTVAHGGHVSEIRVSHTITPDWVTVIFDDNGIGISADKKERIFFRGEGARASVRGLFFVQEILSITGIIIRETGEPGKGARFEMTVPKGMYR